MTEKEEAQKLYEGKYFYEVVKSKSFTKGETIQLFGPFDNIYYATRSASNEFMKAEDNYKYVQVINGNAVQAFLEHEILVTDRKL